MQHVPHTLKGGWTEQAKESLYQRLIDMLSTYAPGIEQQILHGELLTPDDLEKSYRLNGGHWHIAVYFEWNLLSEEGQGNKVLGWIRYCLTIFVIKPVTNPFRRPLLQ